MLAVQEKKFREALAILALVGAKFKVITPDGSEYGDLEVRTIRSGSSKAHFPRYKHGETRRFFMQYLLAMKAGDAKVIDCKEYDPRVIARDISSYCCQTFGNGSVSCLADREEKTVEIFALKDLG